MLIYGICLSTLGVIALLAKGLEFFQPDFLQGLQVGGVIIADTFLGLQVIQHLKGKIILAQFVVIALQFRTVMGTHLQTELMAVDDAGQVLGEAQVYLSIGFVLYLKYAHRGQGLLVFFFQFLSVGHFVYIN